MGNNTDTSKALEALISKCFVLSQQKNEAFSDNENTTESIDLKNTFNVDTANAIKSHLSQNGFKVSVFTEEYKYQATTKMLTKRCEDLFDAFKDLASIPEDKISMLKKVYIEYIEKHFNIDEQKNSKHFNLKKIINEYNNYVTKNILLFLARLHIDNKNIQYGDAHYKRFKSDLNKFEIKMKSEKQRKTYLNLDDSTGYFTAQIPLGLDEKDNPYTYQSYKRDSDKLANYVLHIMGKYDSNSGEVDLFNHSTRAANYVPVKIDDDLELLKKTLAQVKQRYDSIIDLNSNAKSFTQISLLSPIHRLAENFDSQEGLKQTRYTYLAFLLQNLKSPQDSLKIRYVVESVNIMRKNFISDRLKSYINTRYYNQLITDILDAVFSNSNIKNNNLKTLKTILQPLQNQTVKNFQKNINNSWKAVTTVVNEIQEQLDNNTLDLNKQLKAFEAALAKHHSWEEKLYKYRLKNYKKFCSTIEGGIEAFRNEFSQDSAKQSDLINQFNLLQDLNNIFFLKRNNRYQKQKYNYHLQATLHRLEGTLSHEVGVNCNDSEDRTGIENIITMAHYQWMDQNKGMSPNLAKRESLSNIKFLAKKQFAKDAALNNTKANGVPGFQVSKNDIDMVFNHEAFEMTKLTKKPFKNSGVWTRVKAFFHSIGNKIASKFRSNKLNPKKITITRIDKPEKLVSHAAVMTMVATLSVATAMAGSVSSTNDSAKISTSTNIVVIKDQVVDPQDEENNGVGNSDNDNSPANNDRRDTTTPINSLLQCSILNDRKRRPIENSQEDIVHLNDNIARPA